MDALRHDLRFALRLLARNPGTSAVVILVLALGIGANTVLVSVADAKLLHPLPFRQPDRLVQLWETARHGGEGSTLSPFELREWDAGNRTFDAMAAYSYAGVALARRDGAERLRALRVTGAFFSVLGVRSARGRVPTPADDRPGQRVAVLSHAAWERHFASDPGVVGRRVRLDGEPWTVIAVMPADFAFPSSAIEVWLCPAFDLAAHERGEHFLFAVGRLRAEVGITAAQADLDALSGRLGRGDTTHHEDTHPLVVSLREAVIGDTGDEILLLWGGVLLVLVVACANVGNLWLARMLARRGEISVRLAVGGSRGRLVRQMLTESTLLAALGGGAGAALAAWTVRLLASGRGPAALRSPLIGFDGRVLAACLLLTAATAVAFGLGPALAGCRRAVVLQPHADAGGSGGSTGRTTGRRILPRLLVAFQVCFAVVLLTAAGLVVRSLVELHRVDLGFDPRQVLSCAWRCRWRAIPSRRRAPASTPRWPRRSPRYPEWRRSVASTTCRSAARAPAARSPGPTEPASATAKASTPTTAPSSAILRPPSASNGCRARVSTPRRVRGPRRWRSSIAPSSSVLPTGEPLGRHLVLDGPPVRIVGVVETIRHGGLTTPGEPEIYVPALQGQPPAWVFFVVRSPLPVDALAPALRTAVRDVLPDDPLYDVRPLSERIAASIAPQRFDGALLSAFAAVCHAPRPDRHLRPDRHPRPAPPSRHRHPPRPRRQPCRGGPTDRPPALLPAALGLAAGLLLALPTAHAIRSLLYGVRPTDPVVLLTVPVALATVVVLAGYLPARRAAAENPAAVLREG